MVTTPVAQVEVCTMCQLVNHTLQCTCTGTQDVSQIKDGVVVRVIDKEERGVSDHCEARHGYVGGR